MDFRGHLRLPDDAGTGIGVVLRVDDIFVIISAGEQELGAWRADDVVIERIFSNQFAIDLDGEPMVFVAQDALGFAYEGITAIEELQARLTKRGVFRRSRKKDKKASTEETASPSEPEIPDQPGRAPASRRPAAELVSHLDHPEAPDAVPDLEVVPDLSPAPLWTPATAKSSPDPGDDEASPITPDSRSGSGVRRSGGERPADARVSYPRASAPPPPAADSFVPPTEEAQPAATETAPTATSARTESASEDASDSAPPPPEVQVSEPEIEVSEPESESESALELESEIEIEEVTAASSGTAWEEPETRAAEVPEIQIEIEEYIAPTAGEVDTFVAPVPEPEPAAFHTEPESVESASPPEPVTQPEPVEAEPEEEAPIAEPVREDNVEETDVAVAQAEIAEKASDAASTNGHKTEKRRSFLFGRGRDKSVPVHDHEYGEPKTIGGLTRQVCGVCGHVTFSGQDVYQDW